MRKIIAMFALMLLPLAATAGGGSSVHLDDPQIDLSDKASLQRGAKVFLQYCLNCHSANYMRYNRLVSDLGMSEQEVTALMHTTDKIGETMSVNINHAEAKEFFGTLPPDLTVIARSRKPEWLYTYLRSFYRDDARPFGVNNVVFKDVAMPHVLADLQGVAEPVTKQETKPDGKTETVVTGAKLTHQGSLTPQQYDALVRDLVAYLVYMGEPAKLQRYAIGSYVLIFLLVLSLLLFLLKKEYWRDVR